MLTTFTKKELTFIHINGETSIEMQQLQKMIRLLEKGFVGFAKGQHIINKDEMRDLIHLSSFRRQSA